jgi:hypothetical protein
MAKIDPRDAFIDQNLSKHGKTVPEGVIDDLRHFAKRAAEGRTISLVALTKYMKEKRGFTAGHRRLHTIALKNGIEPWWANT